LFGIWPASVLNDHSEELLITSLIVFGFAVGASYFFRILALTLLSKSDEIDEWDDYVFVSSEEDYDSEMDPILSAKEIN
jgi:hypothetical protein